MITQCDVFDFLHNNRFKSAVIKIMGEGNRVHRVLVGKPEGKNQFGGPRCRCEEDIEMDLQEVGGLCGDWMELAQDRER
jgi:hypothetical protein